MHASSISGNPLFLADLTWEEVRDLRDQIQLTLMPIGATEQHGPHLPLTFDTLAAASFCALAARRLGHRVLVAPTIPWGMSSHHMAFPGTLSLRAETLVNLLLDLVGSLHAHGLGRVLIVNGHLGNRAAIELGAVRARDELGVPFVGACTYLSFIDPETIAAIPATPIRGHACEVETSIGMHLKPEMVREGRISRPTLSGLATGLRADAQGFGATLHYRFEELTDNGATGDPTRATAGHGERIMASALDRFCAFVEACIATGDFPETGTGAP